jgi:hypothetical protein
MKWTWKSHKPWTHSDRVSKYYTRVGYSHTLSAAILVSALLEAVDRYEAGTSKDLTEAWAYVRSLHADFIPAVIVELAKRGRGLPSAVLDSRRTGFDGMMLKEKNYARLVKSCLDLLGFDIQERGIPITYPFDDRIGMIGEDWILFHALADLLPADMNEVVSDAKLVSEYDPVSILEARYPAVFRELMALCESEPSKDVVESSSR